jgi:hypothetical protein
MMDNKKIIEQINHVVVDQYVRKLLTLKVARKTLFQALPLIGQANLADSNTLLMFEDPSEIARMLGANINN